MSSKAKEKWVLLFWPETKDQTVMEYSDLLKVTKLKTIKENWSGDLPWVENGQMVLLEAQVKKISGKRSKLCKIRVLDNRLSCILRSFSHTKGRLIPSLSTLSHIFMSHKSTKQFEITL